MKSLQFMYKSYEQKLFKFTIIYFVSYEILQGCNNNHYLQNSSAHNFNSFDQNVEDNMTQRATQNWNNTSQQVNFGPAQTGFTGGLDNILSAIN